MRGGRPVRGARDVFLIFGDHSKKCEKISLWDFSYGNGRSYGKIQTQLGTTDLTFLLYTQYYIQPKIPDKRVQN